MGCDQYNLGEYRVLCRVVDVLIKDYPRSQPLAIPKSRGGFERRAVQDRLALHASGLVTAMSSVERCIAILSLALMCYLARPELQMLLYS